MGKLTATQTAALRAVADGRDPYPDTEAALGPRQRLTASVSRIVRGLLARGILCRGPWPPGRWSLTAKGREALPGSDLTALRDLLELVDTQVPLQVVQAWTWDERAAAEAWAAASHLRASDNLVRVPPVPPHLAPFRKGRT